MHHSFHLNLNKLRQFKRRPKVYEWNWVIENVFNGLQYDKDYSDKYTNRKLVDKVQFVGGL